MQRRLWLAQKIHLDIGSPWIQSLSNTSRQHRHEIHLTIRESSLFRLSTQCFFQLLGFIGLSIFSFFFCFFPVPRFCYLSLSRLLEPKFSHDFPFTLMHHFTRPSNPGLFWSRITRKKAFPKSHQKLCFLSTLFCSRSKSQIMICGVQGSFSQLWKF